MLIKQRDFQLNQSVDHAGRLAVSRSGKDGADLSLDDFASLVKAKVPLKVDHYTLQVRSGKNPSDIKEYEVIRYVHTYHAPFDCSCTDLSTRLHLLTRCSAWPMKIQPDDPLKKDPNAEYIVDTTGAGDSYIGGFIASSLFGWSPEMCMLLGTAVVAEKLQNVGSRKGLPTSDMLVDKLLSL